MADLGRNAGIAELANAAVKAVEALVAKLPPDQAGAAMLKAVDEGGPK
jgi:hypothetical protein